MARLPSFNAVSIHPDFFDEAMERLRTRFLKRPPKALPLPKLPAPVLAGRHGERSRIGSTWSEVSGADEYLLEGSGPPIGSGIGSLQPFREIYRGPNRSYEGARGEPGEMDLPSLRQPLRRVREVWGVEQLGLGRLVLMRPVVVNASRSVPRASRVPERGGNRGHRL